MNYYVSHHEVVMNLTPCVTVPPQKLEGDRADVSNEEYNSERASFKRASFPVLEKLTGCNVFRLSAFIWLFLEED